MVESMNQAILDDATLFQAIGYDIILVDSNKNPGIVKDWPSHQWPESELANWLSKRNDLSLAIRLGDFIDVEIDAEDEEARNKLETAFLARMTGMRTVSWRSKRGRHWLFKLTDSQQKALADLAAPSVVKTGGLEFRLGLSPAQSLLPTPGDSYRTWIATPETSNVVALPAAVWADLETACKEKFQTKKVASEIVPEREQRPGDVFNEKASWGEILEPRGWRCFEDRAGTQHWTRPGKATGLSATTGHCSSDTRGDLFYCFSSSEEVAPIESNKAYSKFELWATLDHGGDYSAAAMAAMRNGYAPESPNDYSEFDEFPEIDGFPKQENGCFQEMIQARTANETTSAIGPIIDTPEPNCLIYDFVLGEYVQKLRPYTEAYPPAILFQLLEVAGILAGRNTYFEHGDYRFRLNGGTIVIGESGISRKGTGLLYARLPFRDTEYEQEISSLINENTQVSGEGFIQAIANKPTHTLLVACEEFASMLKSSKREGSNLSSIIRNAMDAKPLGIDARKNPVPEMHDAFASVIGHCTLDEFIANISLEDISNGFLNRFQFTLSRQNSKIPFPESVPDGIKKPIREAFSKLLGPKEFQPTTVLSFTPDARPVWESFYSADSEARSSLRESLAARVASQVLRNASRIALLEQSTLVDARRLRIAIAMKDYSSNCIDYIFGDYLNDDTDELLDFIASDKNGKTLHDINEWVARWKKPKRHIKRVVSKLLEKGTIQNKPIKPTVGGGRPLNRFIRT